MRQPAREHKPGCLPYFPRPARGSARKRRTYPMRMRRVMPQPATPPIRAARLRLASASRSQREKLTT